RSKPNGKIDILGNKLASFSKRSAPVTKFRRGFRSAWNSCKNSFSRIGASASRTSLSVRTCRIGGINGSSPRQHSRKRPTHQANQIFNFGQSSESGFEMKKLFLALLALAGCETSNYAPQV